MSKPFKPARQKAAHFFRQEDIKGLLKEKSYGKPVDLSQGNVFLFFRRSAFQRHRSWLRKKKILLGRSWVGFTRTLKDGNGMVCGEKGK